MSAIIETKIHQSETQLHPDPANPGQLAVQSHVKAAVRTNYTDACRGVLLSGFGIANRDEAWIRTSAAVGDATLAGARFAGDSPHAQSVEQPVDHLADFATGQRAVLGAGDEHLCVCLRLRGRGQ